MQIRQTKPPQTQSHTQQSMAAIMTFELNITVHDAKRSKEANFKNISRAVPCFLFLLFEQAPED